MALTSGAITSNLSSRNIIPSIVTSGLVLHLDAGNWRSYSGTGTTWSDLSGNGNDCTLTNGPTYSSANGGVFSFDGIDDYVTIPFDATMNVDYVTLSVWIKSTFITGPNARHYVFDGLEHKCMIFVDEPNEINFFTLGGPGSIAWADASVAEDTWMNIVGSYDGSKMALYVNGDEVASTDATGVIANATLDGRIMDYRLNGYETEGLATNFMMYDRGLSASEVQQNFRAQRKRFGI